MTTERFTISVEVEREDDGTYYVAAPTCDELTLTVIAKNRIASAVEAVTDEFEEARARQEELTLAEDRREKAIDEGQGVGA